VPTNLPPEYFEAEERYRAAGSPRDKIARLEELISTIPKHKGTDRLRGNLRRKLAKLKDAAQQRKGVSRQVSAYHIDKEGAGQVVVAGLANVGKSALVATLTNAKPEVADYPFTTWTPTPGMMQVKGVQIQLIDTPPLNGDFVDPEMMNMIRRADLVLLLVDLQAYPIQQLEDAVAILEEHRIIPIHLREQYAERRRITFVPILVVVNKNDDERSDGDFEVFRELFGDDWPLVPVSVTEGRNLERLKQAVFDQLGIICVYSRPPGQEPDFSAPYVLKKGGTVQDFAGGVHQDFRKKLKSARVWGSATYDGQKVSRDYVLQDGDVVELRV
jgi:small GTP-binding protein